MIFLAVVKACNKAERGIQHLEHGTQQNHLTLNWLTLGTKAPLSENKGLSGLVNLLGCVTHGVPIKLKGREDSPSGWSLLGLLSALVNLVCVRQIGNHGFACTPGDIEQFVPALLCLRDTASLKHLGLDVAHIIGMFLAVKF